MADDSMGQDSSSVIFETESDKYVVLMKRETVFTSYHYEMTKINKRTNSFTKKYESVLHYDEVVNIASSEIQIEAFAFISAVQSLYECLIR